MLSKSKYVSGRQCLKKLYLEKHRPDLKPPTPPARQALFDQGHRIGELAQKLYPGGKDATPKDYSDFSASIRNTRLWIESAYEVIYEATFAEDGVLALLDIFLKRDGFIYALEVKSSTKVQPYHLWDAAIQYYVMDKAGFRPDGFYIMHINNQYVKDGDIRLDQLFTKTDVTEDVIALQADIPSQLEEMKAALQGEEEPQVDIGPHCSSPFSCDFHHYCWEGMPKHSVFSLSRINSDKAWALYHDGKYAIADLEEANFRGRAKLQIEGVKYGKENIRKDKIAAWLDTADYPLYFLDFETVGLGVPIPIYDGTRPYQQIPVQYSLHILRHPDADLEHYDFLPDFSEDPRAEMAAKLCQEIQVEGSIIAYSKGFESKCLEHLAVVAPQHANQLMAMRDRLWDLIDPFRKGWFYKPAMGKSASIKSVYPALFPDEEEGYSGLVIANGADASNYLANLAQGNFNGSEQERSQLYQDLRAYCELDTLAMVKIWDYLRGL